MKQHLVARNWQLAKPQKPRAEDSTVVDEIGADLTRFGDSLTGLWVD
jgi:isochorismate synthase EntC